MCNGNCNCGGSCSGAGAGLDGQSSEQPLDRLYAAARRAMAELYPEKAEAINSGRYSRMEEIFAMDALGEKKLPTMLHRCDEERQKEIIDANIETLFTGLSQSMIDFYRKKLDETKPGKR
ncbi:MAG TPA: hypothetical protein PLC15_00780 [Candidatus Obscuribacter sp.]|nr:hypothetical protein [Candidatus Obscuribacter sp.]HNB13877.1 hypothetical protein [Candidatus Obscuribacter sp.]HND67238.1 hypothetical protein [Candidatus Obscuribacter sp.]